MDRIVPSLAARAALLLIRTYKLTLSPFFAGSCRFVPGCADYAAEAVARHGVVRGAWLAARRLGRCHPLGGHGYDPVPVVSEELHRTCGERRVAACGSSFSGSARIARRKSEAVLQALSRRP